MIKLSHFYSEDMSLALIIWVCTLPFIGLVVAPLFGSRMAILSALAVLVGILAACWGLCGWKLVRRK